MKKENTQDLVSFGNYLLSDERRELFRSHPLYPNDDQLGERLKQVHHSDVENWRELNSNFTEINEKVYRVVKLKERLPQEGKEVLFNGTEIPPAFGQIIYNGEHPSIRIYESSGEFDYYPVTDYTEWFELINEEDFQQAKEACEEVQGWFGAIQQNIAIKNNDDGENKEENIK